MSLNEITQQFELNGNKVLKITPYGKGHINDTFVVETGRKRYILQRINTNLFQNPEKLIHNHLLITNYIKKNNPDEKVLTLIPTKDKAYLSKTPLGCFRMFEFVENSTCFDKVTPDLFEKSGEIFGNFTAMLDGFDATKLYDVLPNFHDTELRFQQFEKALNQNLSGRAKECKEEIDFVLKRKKTAPVFMNMLQNGEIPYRVTHNDTKINNLLFDKSGNGGVVIDLDTIMKGAAGFDFGDSIRFGATTAEEDEKDLNKVHFDLNLFKAYTKGYLKNMGSLLTQKEKDTLAFSAILITYECGMRFLTDHLNGDTYFKINHSGHNLERARTQFKLVSDMEKNFGKMQQIVKKESANHTLNAVKF